MGRSFNEQLEQHDAWRREFALRLKLLAQWLSDHDLLESGLQERLQRLEQQVRSDKVMVTFVAEFSRGKSEMVNAVFFAGYGRRIMPATAGRTTMCPTEMGYDPEVPPCLRLLPIETRLQPQALMEWRMVPEKWTRIDLDVNDPQQLASVFERVAQTQRVSLEQAQALGFWTRQEADAAPPIDAEGRVEVPRWRHALINIAHPLLKQGLVILDTPGLNAIGAEPELTVSLIPQSQAVVFILGADTGVTQSDLAIWREHLVSDVTGVDARLVVLNKVDTLWDELSTPEQIQAQIDRQCANTAATLGVAPERVIAVSAQKGLVAKVNHDAALLARSGLKSLEDALGNGMLLEHQRVLRRLTHHAIETLRTEAGRIITTRKRDFTEQILELKGLQGKNTSVIRHMRARVSHEQAEFDLSGARIHALRSVHLKQLRQVFDLLGAPALKDEMAQLTFALSQKGIKLGVGRAYGDTFERLADKLRQAHALCQDVEGMLGASFKQLNTEYGFSLHATIAPTLAEFVSELDEVRRHHLQFLGISNIFRLAQPEFADRLVRALSTRVRTVYQSALAEVELWSKSVAAQLDTQLRERRQAFVRRIEGIDRIHHAAQSLDDRIQELLTDEQAVQALEVKLQELTAALMLPAHVEGAGPDTGTDQRTDKGTITLSDGPPTASPTHRQAASSVDLEIS